MLAVEVKYEGNGSWKNKDGLVGLQQLAHPRGVHLSPREQPKDGMSVKVRIQRPELGSLAL